MKRFSNKTVLVTGASSGIGRAALCQLAREGATAIGVARREDELASVVDKLVRAGHDARFFAADVSLAEHIESLFEWVRKEFGRLDGAFNNAATTQDAYPLSETPVAVFDELFAVNVRGLWLCLREELAIMQKQGSGAIVNCSSIAGVRGFPGLSVYTASKHAVIGMTRSAALDAAESGVRINCICPGTTRTDMTERQMLTRPGGEEATLGRIPLGRMASADEQAEAALWLLSDQSGFVTGHSLVVDGGITVR